MAETKKITLEDFIVKGLRIGLPGTREFNHSKVLALNEEDFGKFYLLLMEEYKDKDNYWKNGNPQCWRCNNGIETPKDMRKLFGRTLHTECFKKDYDETYKSHNLDNVTRKYLERVYSVNIK
jgi:hypothetical protein